MTKCECGCGQTPKTPGARFVTGHNMKAAAYPTNPTNPKRPGLAARVEALERRVRELERASGKTPRSPAKCNPVDWA